MARLDLDEGQRAMSSALMSGRIFLLANDPRAGRVLGRAFQAQGFAPPVWCVVRPGWRWEPGARVDACIFVEEPGGGGLDTQMELIRRIAGQAPVVAVGDHLADLPDGVRLVAPNNGWAARAVEAVIDLLGVTQALLPTYENRLRVLGRELDRRGYTTVSVFESSSGLRVEPEAAGPDELPPFDFLATDFGRLVRTSINSRGEPEWERPRGSLAVAGHERLFRYLGQDLDRRGAERIRIVALARSLVVSGYESTSPYDRAEPFQEMYRSTDLQTLQQRAVRQRNQPASLMERIARRLGIGH